MTTKKVHWIFSIVLISLQVHLCHFAECQQKSFGYDSVVCVCNSTYCDFLPKIKEIPAGMFIWLTSNRDGWRMKRFDGHIDNYSESNLEFDTLKISINHNKRYQKIHGWGGAVTDAAAINIMSLSPGARKLLMKSYFSKDGINYNLIRVPVGGTDLSTRPYTLDDHPDDVNLTKFSLQTEDVDLKIPVIQIALAKNPETKLLASVWSCPAWMKKNYQLTGSEGFLLKKYYQTYADYYIKFLDAYKKHNISFWMICAANEGNSAATHNYKLNSINFSFNDSAKWIVENMGPTLAKSNHKTRIYAFDDHRLYIQRFIDSTYKNTQVLKYVEAIGLHWYLDFIVNPNLQDKLHKHFPNQPLITTEASTAFLPWQHNVLLGSWSRAELLILKIIENLNHWVSGWIDWNIALDTKGGPSYVNHVLDSPIIVSLKKDEFYKQPLFYAMGQFSKFVPRNSVKIFSTEFLTLQTVAFETPDKLTVIQLYNSKVESQRVCIVDDKNNTINILLSPLSINTVMYKR